MNTVSERNTITIPRDQILDVVRDHLACLSDYDIQQIAIEAAQEMHIRQDERFARIEALRGDAA